MIKLTVAMALLSAYILSACSWQKIPIQPEYTLEATIPLKIGVILGDGPTSTSYGPAVVQELNRMRLFESLVYPHRDNSSVDTTMRLNISGDWDHASESSGFSTGSSMTGNHTASAFLDKPPNEAMQYSVKVTSTIEWGLASDTNEIFNKADELQKKRLAFELAREIRADRQYLLARFEKANKKYSPPQLIFNSSHPNSDGLIELSGSVKSDINISEVSINGRALGARLEKNGSFVVTRNAPIGITIYRLSVVDEYGQSASAEIKVEREVTKYIEEFALLDPRKIKTQINPNALALIIGVESYLSLPQAQYAVSDANHFYDYANQALGVPINRIKLLTDTKASRTELLKVMSGWMKTAVINGQSDVYIFFAGHGLSSSDGNKTYLIPADGDRDLLDETSILRDDLIASAKGAKTITLFLDTCYSGGTRTNEVLMADARPIAIVPSMKAFPPNVTVLAAASGSQLSSTYEIAQQGLFSYWLMKGLEGDADTNHDKKITTGELHDYIAKQVGPMAQRRNRQQDPQLMGDSTRVLVSY